MSTTDTTDEVPIGTQTRVPPTEPSDDHSPDDETLTESGDPIGTRTRVE